jgi:D-alanyl-D-alanine carboxypeptidase/D-alanyl-D-alanine-endopeptidase (penicillin-binding protein 4)
MECAMEKILRLRGILVFMTFFLANICMDGYNQVLTKEDLGITIDGLLKRDDIGTPTIGICVQAGDNSAFLYEKNADIPLKPASCNKLQTGAAALFYLGTDFRYSTTLYMTGRIKNRILEGNLVVTGSGDPSISGRYGKDTSDVAWIFRDWAKALKKKGIVSVKGNVIGDDDYFGDDSFGQGWLPALRGEWYEAEISALSFNDNCVDVHWKGSGGIGKPAPYTLNPATKYIKFSSEVIIGKKGSEKRSNFFRKDKSNIIIARGSVPKGDTMTDWCTVYNPTLCFVTVLKDTLRDEGINVTGEPIDLDDKPELKTTLRNDPPTSAVATYQSPPLMTLLEPVNNSSHNFFAEMILKTIGKRIKGEGTFEKGAEAVMEFLRKEDLWENGSVIIDGSGLSYINRATPRQLVNVLRYMSRQPYWAEFLKTLPRGQTKGYLKDRFGESKESKRIAPRIYGKTGYIEGVVGLTGVVYNEHGREIFYSILINNFDAPLEKVRALADSIAFEIARSRIP